jgi:hypothetical protein
MCTPTVAAVATAVAATASVAQSTGLIGPKVKTPKAEPPKDIAGEERKKRARLLQRQLSGAAGPGRRATESPGTGTGPTGFKTKLGQ